ncbi:MAG: methionine--tRNA ligase [Planctomycetota bacterium]
MASPPDNNTFYVTTPIYYVNDKPHLGHVYTTMVADVVARYHRLKGDDTFFLTGVDEHSTKVVDKAAEMGLSTEAWADQNAAAFRERFAGVDMTNDDFVRTSSDQHKARVTDYIAALLKSGDVYEGEYEGWYDAGQEEYVPEKKAKEADYKSLINRKPLVRKTEKNYFFRLSNYREELVRFFEDRDAAGCPFVLPAARKNEVINRIKEAEDVPISRTGTGGWGIPVPGDPEQSIWVWFDALFNYLTYVDTDDRRKYWQSGATHFIAKDILWFHAAIWPALLLAISKCEGYEWVFAQCGARDKLKVYSHSFWVSKAIIDGVEETIKDGKSTGNFLDPKTLDAMVEEFGTDALRYFLSTQGPLSTTDAEFSLEKYIEVYNTDLANTFGNSCSRVSNMIEKYLNPEDLPAASLIQWSLEVTEVQPELHHQACIDQYRESFTDIELGRSAASAIRIVQYVDQLIDVTQPFKLAKDMETNGSQVLEILSECAEALRIASVLLWPFIPNKCEAFWRRIGFGHYAEQLKGNGKGDLDAWVRWGQLEPGTPIEKGEPLFPRYQAEKK